LNEQIKLIEGLKVDNGKLTNEVAHKKQLLEMAEAQARSFKMNLEVIINNPLLL
jgi:hypothetical protein